ncbi:uncharacterized protein LOC105842431 isoform X2 [Bombyx mori]|uniref:Gustatory receptor n=2 Tax=Bombyx TaxID=7090 RepID=B7FF48_BOMMO|nr:uncharacterized protein LOC105842431 isoform X1 [Bombyx mori]DAA06395.1 TPA_inf: gustatory receptor 63 [Bombyx mori]
MQIGNAVIHLKSTKLTTMNTISPTTKLLKIFALNSNIEEIDLKCSTKLRITMTAFVLCSLIFYSLYYKFIYVFDYVNISIKITDCVQMVYDFCQYIVDLYFVTNYGRNISSEYFQQYKIIDKILEVVCYEIIKHRIVKLLWVFMCIWFSSSCFDFIAWFLNYGWITPLVYSVAYIFLLIKILTTLDLSAHIMNVEIRLKMIADLIHHYYMSCEDNFQAEETLCHKNWLNSKERAKYYELQFRIHALKQLSCNNNEIKLLSRCYLMLTEQVEIINRMYGFRILLNSLSLLIDMVRFTNISVRIMIGSQNLAYNCGYFPAVSSIFRLLTCGAVIINLVSHCERVYYQRTRICNVIDHMIVNKNLSRESTEALQEFRNLVQNHPIEFNMANFFQLNYSLLVSIASVVVTYTIILLQSVN